MISRISLNFFKRQGQYSRITLKNFLSHMTPMSMQHYSSYYYLEMRDMISPSSNNKQDKAVILLPHYNSIVLKSQQKIRHVPENTS